MASTTHDGIDVRTAMIGVIIRGAPRCIAATCAQAGTQSHAKPERYSRYKRATTSNHTPIEQDVFALKFDSAEVQNAPKSALGGDPSSGASHTLSTWTRTARPLTSCRPPPRRPGQTKRWREWWWVRRRVVRVVRAHRHTLQPQPQMTRAQPQMTRAQTHAHTQTETCKCTSTSTATDMPDIE